MRAVVSGARVDHMDVILHLDRGTEPVTGWLRQGSESTSLAFIGYLELLALLERLRDIAPVAIVDDGRSGVRS